MQGSLRGAKGLSLQGKGAHLNEVSSLSSPPVSSSSEPALLTAPLATHDGALELDLEVAGVDRFDSALRETVLLLSKARLLRSRILTQLHSSGQRGW